MADFDFAFSVVAVVAIAAITGAILAAFALGAWLF